MTSTLLYSTLLNILYYKYMYSTYILPTYRHATTLHSPNHFPIAYDTCELHRQLYIALSPLAS